MAYTLVQLSTMMDALTARVNQIDGQNLSDATKASLAVLTAQYNSQRSDSLNLVLTLEQLLQTLQATVNTLQSTLNAHLGV
jgi:non-ribosomal peptide synthetase component F